MAHHAQLYLQWELPSGNCNNAYYRPVTLDEADRSSWHHSNQSPTRQVDIFWWKNIPRSHGKIDHLTKQSFTDRCDDISLKRSTLISRCR